MIIKNQNQNPIEKNTEMLFQNLQRLAVVILLVEVFRTLHATGIFQPVEDYLEGLRTRITESLLLIAIKTGGFISITMIVWRVLALIHPIYYLLFFTTLYILYIKRNITLQHDDGVLLDKDEILKDMYGSVSIPEEEGWQLCECECPLK